VSQIASGVAAKNQAEASAARLERIGAQEAGLRSIQAARLLGSIQASFGARGVSGGDVTSTDIEREAMLLEHRDVKRAEFRFTSLADQVRRTGQAQLATGVIGGLSGFLDLSNAMSMEARIAEIEKAAKKQKARTTVPTVIGPAPSLGLPGSAVNTLPRPSGTGGIDPSRFA
jgi:hypothetical protein